jgi:hypothetical protein
MPETRIPSRALTCYALNRRLARDQKGGESGMEALLNNLWATIAAGVVLTVIVALVAHAIAGM